MSKKTLINCRCSTEVSNPSSYHNDIKYLMSNLHNGLSSLIFNVRKLWRFFIFQRMILGITLKYLQSKQLLQNDYKTAMVITIRGSIEIKNSFSRKNFILVKTWDMRWKTFQRALLQTHYKTRHVLLQNAAESRNEKSSIVFKTKIFLFSFNFPVKLLQDAAKAITKRSSVEKRRFAWYSKTEMIFVFITFQLKLL